MKNKKLLIFMIIIIGMVVLYTMFQNNQQKVIELSDEGVVFGNDEAPISICFFTSFSCSKCKALSKSFNKIIEPKIEKGEVRFIYKLTDEYAYNWSDDKFYNWSFLHSAYDNWLELSQEDESSMLSSDEKKKRSMMKESIEQELELLALDGLPIFYINGDRYVGYYSLNQLEELIRNYEE